MSVEIAAEDFDPVNVCRACNQPTPQCLCGKAWRCESCNGRGHHCIDDICRAKGYCMHGDSTCRRCEGDGRVPPERVLVVPDWDAYCIRSYLRDHPELRKEEYESEQTDQDPLLGLCYPAAEAYYHINDCELDVYCLSWSDVDGVADDSEQTHWYLREPDKGRWIDIALPMMPPVDFPPFQEGRRRKFITGDEPSERAQKVLRGGTDE
jgi:hypothetical protein